MKKYKRKLKYDIKESSLARIWKHNVEHDCGAITTFRQYTDCDGSKGRPYTRKEKLQRNKSLAAKLRSLGYGITQIHGKYPEGGEIQKELGYFVVDLNNKGGLEKDLRNLGEYFEQDSILFIPIGAVNNETKAYLIGTNHCPNNDIAYGTKVVFNRGKLGYTSPIYTSYVNGRPFIFENVGQEIRRPGSGMGVWAMEAIAKRHWKEIEV